MKRDDEWLTDNEVREHYPMTDISNPRMMGEVIKAEVKDSENTRAFLSNVIVLEPRRRKKNMSHTTSCNVSNAGSCSVPWCNCACHHPSRFVPTEPKRFEPDPSVWRPIPNFGNYEMNYLGHLRYVGSVNTIRWVDLDGSKWYELQTKNPNRGSGQEFVVHIFPMLTLVKTTFPEIFEQNR